VENDELQAANRRSATDLVNFGDLRGIAGPVHPYMLL
jgi:hypothetical protein